MNPDDYKPGHVLLHPEGSPTDPIACRIIARSMPHPDDWPWMRLTGYAHDVPPRHSDLSDWRRQSLTEVARVLGHKKEETP